MDEKTKLNHPKANKLKEKKMKKTFTLISVAYVALVILILEIITAPSTEQPLNQPTTPKVIATQFEDENLLQQIHAYAKENNSPPIDAKIDTVWKAIPGYNGLEVNIEQSYLNMWPSEEFIKEKLIFKERVPKIHLEDLSAAPIYKGNPEKPMVSFLINVAWGDEFIPPILEALKKHDVYATFFFDGSWTKKNPELARQIFSEGHEIGNHAYSHPDLKTYSKAQTRKELKMTNDVIQETLNIEPKWFAPPSGSFKDETVEIARELNMYTILWTVDTIDWRKPNTSQMVNRVVSEVHNGAMVLMHPTKPTAEGIDQMISQIKKKGYHLGTVTEMMDETRILPNPKNN